MNIKNPSPEQLSKLIGRISAAFSYNKEESVARDFPQLYSESNIKHLWVECEGNDVLAHAGYYPAVMKVEGFPLSVAGIGGVYTEAGNEGKGFATSLINKCCEEALRGGAALAFLWSDKHEFYAKQGFHLVGRQWTVSLEPRFVSALREAGEKRHLTNSNIRFAENDFENDFIQQSRVFLNSYPLGLSRTEEEHEQYLANGSCSVFSAWAGKELLAYMVVGKGKDLPNYIHEWGGDEAALLHLAAWLLERAGKTLFLLSPQFMPEEVPFLYVLDSLGMKMQAEYMALVRILDFPRLRKLALSYVSHVGVKDGDFDLYQREGKYFVQWKGAVPMELTEAQMLGFLFGPAMPTHEELKALFPMRLWYWGMDSV